MPQTRLKEDKPEKQNLKHMETMLNASKIQGGLTK